MAEREQGAWERIIAENPGHSHWYAERFRKLAAQGDDIVGEARFVDAMAPRGARVLDAGCGGGRVGGHLHRVGHQVVGVDLDPVLIEAATEDYPGPVWLVGDLADLDLPARGIDDAFDVIVSAGNVMTFVAPSARRGILGRLRAHLREDGRLVTGFGAGRGYGFDEFLADAAAAGLEPDLLLESWDLRPFGPESDFLVAVMRPA
jgi:SAM-dependent methyltransferase